jgi:hypothetical protein
MKAPCQDVLRRQDEIRAAAEKAGLLVQSALLAAGIVLESLDRLDGHPTLAVITIDRKNT